MIVFFKNTFCTDNCVEIKRVNNIKYLGVILDEDVSWKKHIKLLKSKLNSTLRNFYFLGNLCNSETLRSVYFALVHSRIDYGIAFWCGTYKSNINMIKILQKHFIRILSKSKRSEASYPLFIKQKILPLRAMFIYKVLKIFYTKSGNVPEVDPYKIKLRSTNVLVPKPSNTFFTKTMFFIAPKVYNALPNEIKNSKNINIFLKKIRSWLLSFEDAEVLIQVQV